MNKRLTFGRWVELPNGEQAHEAFVDGVFVGEAAHSQGPSGLSTGLFRECKGTSVEEVVDVFDDFRRRGRI